MDTIENRLIEIKAIVGNIHSQTFKISVCINKDRLYLQVSTTNGIGRKWWLSEHMTTSEIVRTAFMAMLAYNEHELRESFTYKGVAVFNPHIDVNALADIANVQDRRRESPGAWELES